MTISELARAAGVRVSTLRFYERRGLVKPASRTRAGYRRFGEEDVARVRFLRRAQELGFSLQELGAMLTLSRARTIVTSDIARVGTAKLEEIDARIADLRRVRSALASLLASQCVDPDAPCPIIAALADHELHPRLGRTSTKKSETKPRSKRTTSRRRTPESTPS